jgi:signal transduction histidine kinase
VERIRTQVAAIDAQRLTERVAVPPTRDEIAALAATMNVMLDRLQASHRSQRAFVSDASHELRSPLATLTTAAELALDADEATRSRLLGTINAELGRMRGLVDNLMTLARADAQDLVPHRTDVDLDDLVHDEARRLRATSSRKVELVVEPVQVRADQPRLAQALRNLVDNAERHARTTVRLSLGVEGEDAVLRVDNDGPAIEPADRERVFERFVRLDASRSRDAGGSGLGLAIARTALRTHAGDVVIPDAPDGWCRFELRLPLAAPVEPAQATVANSSSPSPLPATVAEPTPSSRA